MNQKETNKIKTPRLSLWILAGIVLLSGILSAAALNAQEINLDKMEQCGDLVCYPSLQETDVFYYLPDRPRLAMKDGRPQFSFLKYARVKETGEAGTGRAEGGGIVHFLATYGADESRVKAAEKALQQTHENARIAGPIVYRKGSFALVTSFTEGAETLTRTVAVGRAPLMEGQKTAVSMALTREGAELLWESFQSATPDISLVFDMEFAGIREPYEATLEADWKRVSNHHRVQAGGQYKWFGIDVDLLFQELRQSGAVKVTTKGEHAAMDKILESVNAKLLSVMFDPAPDELSRMAAEKSSYDNLNQAMKMLKGNAATGGKTSKRIPLPQPENRMRLIRLAFARFYPGLSLAYAAEQAGIQTWREKEEFLLKHVTLYDKALQELSQGKYQEALESLDLVLMFLTYDGPTPDTEIEEVLKNDSWFRGKVLYDIGRVHKKAKRYKKAVVYFKEAMNLLEIPGRTHTGLESQNPWPSNAAYSLGECYVKLEDFSKALAAYGICADLSGAKETSPSQYRYALDILKELAPKAYNHARRLDELARSSGYGSYSTGEALTAYQNYLKYAKPSGQRADEVEGRIRYLKSKLGEEPQDTAAQTVAQTEQAVSEAAGPSKKEPEAPEKSAKDQEPEKQTAAAPTDKLKKTLAPAKKKAEDQKKKVDGTKKADKKKAREKNTPGFSLVASYQMRHIKRSGKLVYHMNHYRTETQAFAMTENIGNLYRRYGRDPRVFRAVNIDDPVFKQREIHVTLDGQDSETFGKHMNFVTVQMKKRHQSGDLTTDEVVITPERFNQAGNAFNLLYGWKGDDDREAWLNYTLETLWSFHGGMEIKIPSTTHDSAMVALQPPHRYRTVTVEGEGEALAAAGVRHAVIKFVSTVAGEPLTTETTIRNQGPASSLILDIPEDRDAPPPFVSITWYLRGGSIVTAPPRELEGNIIYWDELPDTEV